MRPSFDAVELAAIARIALSMAEADGHVDPRELDAIGGALSQYGVPRNTALAICAAAVTANEANAIAVVAGMTLLQKTDLIVWLLAVIVADGVIAESEIEKFRSLGIKCGFPTDIMEDALRKVKRDNLRKVNRDKENVSQPKPASSTGSGCMLPLFAIISASVYAAYWIFA